MEDMSEWQPPRMVSTERICMVMHYSARTTTSFHALDMTYLDDSRRRWRGQVAVQRGVKAECCPRRVVILTTGYAAKARRRAHRRELARGACEALPRCVEVLLRALAQAVDSLQQQLAQLQARE